MPITKKRNYDPSGRFAFPGDGAAVWFRFDVAGNKATVVEDVLRVSIDPGPIAIEADTDSCTLSLEATVPNGEVAASLRLDPRTNALRGRLVRTNKGGEAEETRVTGVRTDGPPTSPVACVVPGIYELTFDPEVAWKNAADHDDRPCDRAPELASGLFLRVEPYGDELMLSVREPFAPYREAWGDVTSPPWQPTRTSLWPPPC